MSNLLRTRDDVFFYLINKRDEIKYMAQQAQDLSNASGAEALNLAAEQLTAIIKSIMPERKEN